MFRWPSQGDALRATKGSICEQLGLSSGTEFCPKTGAVVGPGSAPQLPRCTGQPQPGRRLTGMLVAGPTGAVVSTEPRGGEPQHQGLALSLSDSRDTLCLQTPALRLPREMNELNRAAPAPDPQAAEPRAEMQPQPRRAREPAKPGSPSHLRSDYRLGPRKCSSLR